MILKNKQIVITRDVKQAAPFIKEIELNGGKAICFPTIVISEPEYWNEVDEKQNRLSDYDWLVFTSANSVMFFIKRLQRNEIKLPPVRIAAIGSKTNKILQEFGCSAHLLPDNFTAMSLLSSFEQDDIKNKRILLPVSDIARNELYEGLRQRGAEVDRVVVYQNRMNDPENKKDVITLIQKNKIDVLTFFSPSAVRNFIKIIGPKVVDMIRRHRTVIAVIGPTTADAVRELNLTPTIESVNSTSDDLIRAIKAYYETVKD